MSCPVHGWAAPCRCGYARGWKLGVALLATALLGNCFRDGAGPTAEEKARALEITACIVRANCGKDKVCFAEAAQACASDGAVTGAGGA